MDNFDINEPAEKMEEPTDCQAKSSQEQEDIEEAQTILETPTPHIDTSVVDINKIVHQESEDAQQDENLYLSAEQEAEDVEISAGVVDDLNNTAVFFTFNQKDQTILEQVKTPFIEEKKE